LEGDWRLCGLNDNKRRLKIALTGILLTLGFAAGLRGDEIPRIKLGLIWKYWREAQDDCAPPHVPLTMTVASRFRLFLSLAQQGMDSTLEDGSMAS
jgi:hypothetical protein